MVKRISILCLAILFLFISASQADMKWKQDTTAQMLLKTYIDSVNACLAEKGEQQVNSLFEIYPGFAVFGITEVPDSDLPESVEITINMDQDMMKTAQLRVSEIERFPVIAASMIKALCGDNLTYDEALYAPKKHAEKARKEPKNSFEEYVEELNGPVPRFYYAYYPDQYHDGVNWIQMTVIFPLDLENWDGYRIMIGEATDSGADPVSDAGEDYEGYFSEDDYSHLDVYVTPTPEPDSAAAEYDFR